MRPGCSLSLSVLRMFDRIKGNSCLMCLPQLGKGGLDGGGGGGGGGAKPAAGGKKTKLSAKWLFDAAMLSSPIDLSQLVTLSKSNPKATVDDVGLPERMVTIGRAHV